MTSRLHITRLAPSPTGALHLGNARTFLINWAIARTRGWRIELRIEDFDTPRVKPGSSESLMRTLKWLGMDWDSERPLVQTSDISAYEAAICLLAEHGLAYPCALTRQQIELSASAPQEGAHETAFPLALRPSHAGQSFDFARTREAWIKDHGESPNWRFVCPAESVTHQDMFAGTVTSTPGKTVGDFVLWTKRDQPSYQLAVVVDDARQRITDVIRGDDLLDSAARQIFLYRSLGHTAIPTFWHVPLVYGLDGLRLAKRHGESKIEVFEAMGIPAEAIIGLLGYWSIPGIGRTLMSADEFKARFDPATMPRNRITFTAEDDAWLRNTAR